MKNKKIDEKALHRNEKTLEVEQEASDVDLLSNNNQFNRNMRPKSVGAVGMTLCK